MDSIRHDLRLAARGFARAPGFTAVAVLTLALGLGANTVIFSVVHDVLLAPLGYEEPARIVRVWPGEPMSEALVDHFRERSSAYSALSAYAFDRFSLTGVEEAEVLSGSVVSPEHFGLLGIEAAHGRTFLPEEGRPGADGVVVLSHGLWQRRFGGDPDVLGRTLELGGRGHTSRTVVGVMPPGFRPLSRSSELWVPLAPDPADAHQYTDMIYLGLLGRLADGVDAEGAAAEARAIVGALPPELAEHFGERAETAGVTPLPEHMVSEVRRSLLLLAGAVALVLLVACANVANLLLARAGGREREVAIRAALGAGRRRLLAQLLTEAALLGALGGVAGAFLAFWTETALHGRLPADLPRASEVAIGGPELLFTGLLALVAAVLCGLPPALRLSREPRGGELQGAGRSGGPGPGSQRLSRLLVAGQVALSMVLVIAAALMTVSLWRLHRVEPGFEPRGVLSLRLLPPVSRYAEEPALSRYFAEVAAEVSRLPGVESVGAINLLPVAPGGMGVGYSVEERPDPSAPPRAVSFRSVLPGYLEAMRIPLVAGRALSERDRADAPPVGLVNRTLAQRHWPDGGAVGQTMRWDDGSPWFEIVGVVGDVRQHRLDQAPQAEVYLPFDQTVMPSLFLTVRVKGDDPALAGGVRRAVRAVDPDVPIADLAWLEDVVAESLAETGFLTLLLAAFGLVALTLGAVGVYGVASHAVSRRRHEMGVRLALGAQPRRLVVRVLTREMRPVAAGVTAGMLAAAAATRIMSQLLYGVSATDPMVFAAVATVLVGAALAAGYLPARRAARVDPTTTLQAP